ncbi:hypothetical protein JCM5353_006242 [Sporobolomyces roseus]
MDQPRIPPTPSSSSSPIPVPSILISPSSPSNPHPLPTSTHSKPTLNTSPRLPGSLPSPPSSNPPSRTNSNQSQSQSQPQTARSTSQSFFASLTSITSGMSMSSFGVSLGGILSPNGSVKGVLEGATFARGTKGEGEKEEGDGASGRRENEREENESESESESESEESEGEEEGPRTRMNTSSNDDSLKEEEEEGTSGGQVGRQSMDLRIEQATTGPSSVSDTPSSSIAHPSPIELPPFSTLHRTPSSAFRVASSSGPIHPLTLQAIKRKDSEAAAIKFEEEMGAQFERRDTEGFGSLGRVRSESPVQIEEDDDGVGGERMERGREDSQATLRQGEGFGMGLGRPEIGQGRKEELVRDQGRNVSNAPATSTTKSKKGFFSRFKKSKPEKNEGLPPVGKASHGMGSVASGSGSGSGIKRSGSVVSRDTTTDSRFGGGGPVTPGLSEVGESHSLGTTTTTTTMKQEKVRHPKVRTKGKSRKDFNHLFLAQELHLPSSSSSSSVTTPSSRSHPNSMNDTESLHSLHTIDSIHSLHHSPQEIDGSDEPLPLPASASPDKKGKCKNNSSGTSGGSEEKGEKKKKKKSRAVWAVKFSNNGKWLAVGGRDGVVRIWEVLSNKEDRESSGLNTTTNGIMPVFKEKPKREWKGHSSDVLDLNWSKNDFLLSSSMDKTVRLWHIDRDECLCSFEHLDFVTSIAFHPKDDRFFLSGSLDCKLRLWNIVEKRVQVWTELPELITAVSFTRDGKFAIAGSFVGQCMFFEVETFKYHNVFTAKSSKRKDQKGKKITSLCTFPLNYTNPAAVEGEDGDRLLVTSNDSHMRLYNTKGRFVEAKYSGHENTSSQIRASFSDDGKYVISGSEDRHVYIWDSGIARNSYGEFDVIKKRSEGTGFESFSMPAHIVTAALFAPATTRTHLASAGDPIFSNEEHYPHLSPFPYTSTRSSAGGGGGGSEADSGGRKGKGKAEDMIIVVADAETGTISIFRNSIIPPPSTTHPPPPSSSAPHSATGSSIFRHNNHVSTTSIGVTDKRRWSRASASSH